MNVVFILMEKALPHLVLLGDSIFANGKYVQSVEHDLPSVGMQFEAAGHGRWTTHCAAWDGARMRHVYQQLEEVPQVEHDNDAIYILSVGGNDGLHHVRDVSRGRAHWASLFTFETKFEAEYEALVVNILRRGRPIVLLTIYRAWFVGAFWKDKLAALGVWRMCMAIRRVAERHGLAVIDLWSIFDRAEDFANPIEPGVPGGHKIVRNFASLFANGAHQRHNYSIWADSNYDADFTVTGYPYWHPDKFAPAGRGSFEAEEDYR